MKILVVIITILMKMTVLVIADSVDMTQKVSISFESIP